MKLYIQMVTNKMTKQHAWAVMNEYGMIIDVFETPKECQKKIDYLIKQSKTNSVEQI